MRDSGKFQLKASNEAIGKSAETTAKIVAHHPELSNVPAPVMTGKKSINHNFQGQTQTKGAEIRGYVIEITIHSWLFTLLGGNQKKVRKNMQKTGKIIKKYTENYKKI